MKKPTLTNEMTQSTRIQKTKNKFKKIYLKQNLKKKQLPDILPISPSTRSIQIRLEQIVYDEAPRLFNKPTRARVKNSMIKIQISEISS